jgi:hypothetical protein
MLRHCTLIRLGLYKGIERVAQRARPLSSRIPVTPGHAAVEFSW